MFYTSSAAKLDNSEKNLTFAAQLILTQLRGEQDELKLDWESITDRSPYYNHLQSYDKSRWETSNIENGIYTDVHIDTTFALYNVKHYFVGGGSLTAPYIAKHYPWELTEEDRNNNDEFSYYEDNVSLDQTGSFLAPYITTIALYDNELNMVAVAKLPQPIKSTPDYPINFIIRFDS